MATLDELIAEFQRSFTEPFQEAPPQTFNVGPEGFSPPSEFEQFTSVPDLAPLLGPQPEPGSTDVIPDELLSEFEQKLRFLQEESQGAAPTDIFAVRGDEALRGTEGGGFAEFDLDSTPFNSTSGNPIEDLLLKFASDEGPSAEDRLAAVNRSEFDESFAKKLGGVQQLSGTGLKRDDIRSQIESRETQSGLGERAADLADVKEARATLETKASIEKIFADIRSGDATTEQGQQRLDLLAEQIGETERSNRAAESREDRKIGITEKQNEVDNDFKEAELALKKIGVADDEANTLIRQQRQKLDEKNAEDERSLTPFRKEASAASTALDVERKKAVSVETKQLEAKERRRKIKDPNEPIASKLQALREQDILTGSDTELPNLPEEVPFATGLFTGSLSPSNILLPSEGIFDDVIGSPRKRNREDVEAIRKISKILNIPESKLKKLIREGDSSAELLRSALSE